MADEISLKKDQTDTLNAFLRGYIVNNDYLYIPKSDREKIKNAYSVFIDVIRIGIRYERRYANINMSFFEKDRKQPIFSKIMYLDEGRSLDDDYPYYIEHVNLNYFEFFDAIFRNKEIFSTKKIILSLNEKK